MLYFLLINVHQIESLGLFLSIAHSTLPSISFGILNAILVGLDIRGFSFSLYTLYLLLIMNSGSKVYSFCSNVLIFIIPLFSFTGLSPTFLKLISIIIN